MNPMYKIAVMGDRDSVLGFQALGLDVYFAEDTESARHELHRLAANDYAIIYITEQLSLALSDEIKRYKDSVTPAIILIPGKGGSMGLGEAMVHSAVERAVGADIS